MFTLCEYLSYIKPRRPQKLHKNTKENFHCSPFFNSFLQVIQSIPASWRTWLGTPEIHMNTMQIIVLLPSLAAKDTIMSSIPISIHFNPHTYMYIYVCVGLSSAAPITLRIELFEFGCTFSHPSHWFALCSRQSLAWSCQVPSPSSSRIPDHDKRSSLRRNMVAVKGRCEFNGLN